MPLAREGLGEAWERLGRGLREAGQKGGARAHSSSASPPNVRAQASRGADLTDEEKALRKVSGLALPIRPCTNATRPMPSCRRARCAAGTQANGTCRLHGGGNRHAEGL